MTDQDLMEAIRIALNQHFSEQEMDAAAVTGPPETLIVVIEGDQTRLVKFFYPDIKP